MIDAQTTTASRTRVSTESVEADSSARSMKIFIAGAVAGAVSRTATAPLDRMKMLLQVWFERFLPLSFLFPLSLFLSFFQNWCLRVTQRVMVVVVVLLLLMLVALELPRTGRLYQTRAENVTRALQDRSGEASQCVL